MTFWPVPAQAGCGDTVPCCQLIRSRAQEIQDYVGVCCPKVCKHGFQGAVVTEIALAQESEQARCRRASRYPGASPGLMKSYHEDLFSQPSTVALTETASWLRTGRVGGLIRPGRSGVTLLAARPSIHCARWR